MTTHEDLHTIDLASPPEVDATPKAKRTYAAPQLQEFGSLTELTHAAAGEVPDGFFASVQA